MHFNLRHILIGWGKKFGILPTSKAEEKLSELRLKVCGACRYAKESKILAVINGNVQNNVELLCTLCHCPCLEKTLVVDEECPIKKW